MKRLAPGYYEDEAARFTVQHITTRKPRTWGKEQYWSFNLDGYGVSAGYGSKKQAVEAARETIARRNRT